jgi:hypothetical protein
MWDRRFVDGKQGFAGHTIKQEQHAMLGGLRHGIHRAPIAQDGEQNRRAGRIAILNIVMHQLEMPQFPARARIQRHQRIGVEIVPLRSAP